MSSAANTMETCEEHTDVTESEELSSDMNGFLSGTCMETDEKSDPFSSDSALGFPVESARFDSECIMSSSLVEGVSIQQTTTCDSISISGELSSTAVQPKGPLLFYDDPSLSRHPPTNPNNNMHISSSNVVLVSGNEATGAGHKLELLSPVHLYSAPGIISQSQSQPHPIVIGNASAASFVKSVFKNAQSIPYTQSNTAIPSNPKEIHNVSPGLVLLNSSNIPQFSLLQSAPGIGSSPMLIHLPATAGMTWATGAQSPPQSTVIMSALTSRSQSQGNPGAHAYVTLPSDGTMTNSIPYCNVAPSLPTYQPSQASVTAVHHVATHDCPVTEAAVSSNPSGFLQVTTSTHDTTNVDDATFSESTSASTTHLSRLSSTANSMEKGSVDAQNCPVNVSGIASSINRSDPSLSQSQSGQPSAGHPIVITCARPEADGNKGMQQILQHFLQQNNKAVASVTAYNRDEKPLIVSADVSLADLGSAAETVSRCAGPMHTLSVKDAKSTGLTLSGGQLHSLTVPGLAARSNSVVLVLRKQVSQTCGQTPGNQQLVSSSASAHAVGPSTSRLGGEEDEIDGSAASLERSSSSVTNNSPTAVASSAPCASAVSLSYTPVSSEQTGIYPPTLSIAPTSSTLTTDSANDNHNDSSTQPNNDIQWMEIQLPANIHVADTSSSGKSASKETRSEDVDNLQKLIPLTVSEKLSSDMCHPIMICIMQEDGVVKKININPVERSRNEEKSKDASENITASHGSCNSNTVTPSRHDETMTAGPLPPSHADQVKTTGRDSESKPPSYDPAVSAMPSCVSDSVVSDSIASQVSVELSDVSRPGETKDDVMTSATATATSSKEQYNKWAAAASSREECEQYKCDLCTAVFTRHGNYTRHRKIHNLNIKEDKLHKCPYCERPFLQRCDMNRHIVVHTNQYPYRCKTCDKGYIRKSDLVVHERFHSKDKAFKCDKCGRSFYQSGDLRRHKRFVHSEHSQLSCSHCQRKYASEGTLIRHMKTAHNDVLMQSLAQRTQQTQ